MYNTGLPAGRRATTRRAIAGVCALTVGVLGWLNVTPGTQDQVAVAAPTSAVSDDKTAAARAKASGERVELLGKRTETEQTFANPNGTFTLEQSNMPVRTRKDGQWVDLDPTLSTSPDGRVRPKATSLDMSFSGGGDDPLISMKSDGHELKLKWPGALPEPVVAGDNVTYPNVFPDVDLKITAAPSSYTEVLVVKTPAAARLPQLQQLNLAMEAPGLNVAEVAGGAVLAKDELGKVIFTGPPPVMWDSRGDGQGPADEDRTEAPLEGDKVVQIPLEVSQDSIKISPAASLVNDAAAEYPLHIDPPFAAAQNGRAMIDAAHPTTSSWMWTDTEGVGYQNYEPPTRKRLIFKMDIGHVVGTHITSAVFSAYETWAASCAKKEVQVWKTAAISTSINWNNGSGSNVWLKKVASVTDAVGRNECTPNGKWLEFNVLTAVAEQAAARSGWVHLGLRAANEADQLYWKRFGTYIRLAITYNNVPEVSGMRTSNPTSTGCATSAAPARISGRNPIPKVKILDNDQQPSQAGFEFWYNGDSEPRWRKPSATMVSSGTLYYTPQGTVPDLDDNRLVGWRARAWDGEEYSPWSQMCWLYIDATKPPPPTVTVRGNDPGTVFPLGQPITVDLKTTVQDTNYFRYTIDTEEPTSPVVTVGPGMTGTFTYKPTRPGPLVIRAWTFDRVGNRSAEAGDETIPIAVGTSSGRWHMDEGDGNTLTDNSGKAHPITLGSAQTWTEGDRWQSSSTGANDWAITMPGNNSAASAAANIIDTSRSFSVSARVRLAAKPGRQVAVSEDRPGTSGFTLGAFSQDLTLPDEPKVVWSFSVADPDGSGEVFERSLPTSYSPGEWVYLTGVYDSFDRSMTLFVNDILVTKQPTVVPGTVAVPDGIGALRLGQSTSANLQTNFLQGEIDDVRIYPGPIDGTVVFNDFYNSFPTG